MTATPIATTTTTHVIPLKPSETFRDDPHAWGSDTVIVVNGKRFKLGYFDPQGECRREFEGPILPGPYAFLVALSVIIDCGLSAEQIAAGQLAGTEFEVNEGDVLDFDGIKFELVFPRTPGTRHARPVLRPVA